ncbi:uncharacterized protein LOC117652003 [Thrips palmi]|uniref:Uncharacterized protein LOC117652003 n=1 Tax=Thrips palmi TaxID=161013 RepID=A0A6P9A4S9_THRPL|nr:uncharacterized protein LOC117652003 [Thrips palmi]
MRVVVTASVDPMHVVVVGRCPTPACRLSEYFCDNGRCVPLNRYCDAANDCGDASDEPRGCTPCNRTYYGTVGRTYSLELHRPKEDRLPFLCHLTFTAGGGELGDLVQLTFESFTVGRFTSFTTDGCPDGSMAISESGRPTAGGAWCGPAWGPAVYFSETRSLLVTVKLQRLHKDSSGYNFDFRLGYRLLPRDRAVVRYGGKPPPPPLPPHLSGIPPAQGPGNPWWGMGVGATNGGGGSGRPDEHYLGDLIAGTYCSRLFSDCDRKPCRLQSPNFPGVYPRNLTCYYAVRQHEVPAGMHALVTVSQPDGQLTAVRSTGPAGASSRSSATRGPTRGLRVWQECDEVQDYVTVYDGYTTRDPVLLRFCGGGEPVPPVTSSGPELLVEFSTSAFGCLEQPGPLQPLHGFQLEVQVQFVDARSPQYSKGKRCELWVRGAGRGLLESPRHSLPRNATCLFHLQGPPARFQPAPWRSNAALPPPRFRVWLSVLKFHVTTGLDASPTTQVRMEESCASQLRVWDGSAPLNSDGSPVPSSLGNTSLLARYCKDRVPRSCDHGLLTAPNRSAARGPRPCSLAESFLSSGDALTLELRTVESTALRPVSFRALYEFVDLHQDGLPYPEAPGPCSRRFIVPGMLQPQTFQSPRDVFLFGRGGAANLSCVYRFEAQPGEHVRLTLTRVMMGGRACRTREVPELRRLYCAGDNSLTVRVLEEVWPGRPLIPRDCLCSGDHMPYTFISSSPVVEIHFTALNMDAADDFRKINMMGAWTSVRQDPCTRPRRLAGPSGSIQLGPGNAVPAGAASTPHSSEPCDGVPWLVEPAAGRYLYVTVRGVAMHPNDTKTCATKNRVSLHAGRRSLVVCPEPAYGYARQIEVVSEGWVVAGEPPFTGSDDASRSVAIEFIGNDPGSYLVSWLELSRRPLEPPSVGVSLEALELCRHRCPELDACINASLWCDGTSHCPSGYDEAATHCWVLLQLPVLHLLAGSRGKRSLESRES